jgi:hypothetical protein
MMCGTVLLLLQTAQRDMTKKERYCHPLKNLFLYLVLTHELVQNSISTVLSDQYGPL